MTLPDLLKTTVDLEGSDLHLTTGTPPQVRVHGELWEAECQDGAEVGATVRIVGREELTLTVVPG